MTDEERRNVLAGIPITTSETAKEIASEPVVATETTEAEAPVVATTDGRQKVATVARLIVMILSLANELLVSLGCYTIPNVDETVLELASLAIVVVAALVNYWKNNSWTENAQVADWVLDALKDGKITPSDILTILANVSDKKSNK